MDRKEFISLVGLGAGALFMGCGMTACKKDSASSAPTVDFILDLTKSENASLNVNGGSRVVSGVIVAKTLTGSYIAVSAACTHEGTTINFDGVNNRFHCPNHGSNFSPTGAVVAGPASSALKKYTTTLTGSSLRVSG